MPASTSSETRSPQLSPHPSKTTPHGYYDRKASVSNESEVTMVGNTWGKNSRIYALSPASSTKLPPHTHLNTMESLKDTTECSKKEHSHSDMTPDSLADSRYPPYTQSILSGTAYYTHVLAYHHTKHSGESDPGSIGSELMDQNAGHSYRRQSDSKTNSNQSKEYSWVIMTTPKHTKSGYREQTLY